MRLAGQEINACGEAGQAGSSQALWGGLWWQFQAEWTQLPSGPGLPGKGSTLKNEARLVLELDKAEQSSETLLRT